MTLALCAFLVTSKEVFFMIIEFVDEKATKRTEIFQFNDEIIVVSYLWNYTIKPKFHIS